MSEELERLAERLQAVDLCLRWMGGEALREGEFAMFPTTVKMALEACAVEIERSEAENEALKGKYGERQWVDITPDAGLPSRLLSAYVDDTYWSDNTAENEPVNPVFVAMNEHREQRNVILRDALAKLRTAREEASDG